MTPLERVNAAIERKPHDRIPRFETFWGDTITRWTREGLTRGSEEALEALKADMECVSSFPWPSPYPGQNVTVSEDLKTRIFRDEWGATLRLFKDHQTTPEHLGWECDSVEAWHGGIRQRILDTNNSLDLAVNQARFSRAAKEKKWTFFNTVEPFESMRKLIGDEETMVGIKDDPEWIADMAEVTTTRSLRTAEALFDSGIHPDGFWIYGDMAFNHATFCSPEDYRNLVWPQHKRMCDWAHERGMKTIYHTDGNVNGVFDLFIQAGIDIIQPLESKAGMDLRKLAPEYGHQISFFGNIDVMVLIRGNLSEIEAEIQSKFAAGMSNNGYIYHSDHSIPPQVSWELYQKVIQLVEKYGNYE